MAAKKKVSAKKKPAKRKSAVKRKYAPGRKKGAKKPAKRKKSNAGTAKLKKIVAQAKTIYKDGKSGMKWTSAVKKAAKSMK